MCSMDQNQAFADAARSSTASARRALTHAPCARPRVIDLGLRWSRPLHVELDELASFDIFTYHFGDVFRLYLRGQFAAHRNSPKVNMLWAECPHLGSGCAPSPPPA